MTVPFGRPREYDREKIAKDLIEWAKKPDSINLNKFCCSQQPPLNPRRLTEFAGEHDYFLEAYETAKSYLAARREEKLTSNQLHVKAYDLNATTYDYFLKQEKRAQAQYESELKKQEDQKPQTVIIYASADLASGSNLPAKRLSETSNPSPQ
jgi:hypothetical protein